MAEKDAYLTFLHSLTRAVCRTAHSTFQIIDTGIQTSFNNLHTELEPNFSLRRAIIYIKISKGLFYLVILVGMMPVKFCVVSIQH